MWSAHAQAAQAALSEPQVRASAGATRCVRLQSRQATSVFARRDSEARSTKPAARCDAVALGVVSAAAAVPAVAGAASVRSVVLRGGLTSVDLQVPHRTGTSPPAVVLSTSSANLRCSVAGSSYINHERRGLSRMRVRCLQVPRGARETPVFRAPFLRAFRLRNGAGSVRVEVDKLRGDALPLGRLTTRPRDSDCEVTRSRVRTGSRRVTARARPVDFWVSLPVGFARVEDVGW